MKGDKRLGKGLEEISHLFLSPTEAKQHSSAEHPEPVPPDQEIAGRRFPKVVAITGDHRSLEKSFLVSNLALELARRNRRVRLVDADLSFPDQPFLWGLRPASSMARLACAEENGQDREVILQGPLGVRLLSLDIDFSRLTALPESARHRLVTSLMAFEADAQLMLVDTPPSFSYNARLVLQLADQIVVMVPSEPLGMIDSYSVIKGILALRPDAPLGMVAYKVRTVAEAGTIASKMSQTVSAFLGVSVANLGYLYADLNIDRSIAQRTPLVLAPVKSRAAQCLAHISDAVWAEGKGAGGAPRESFFAAMNKALENGQ